MKIARISAAAAAVVGLGVAALAIAPAAQASEYNGCYVSTVCFYYNPSWAGASAGFDDGAMPDMLSPLYLFPNNGNGAGRPVGNDAGSVYNKWSDEISRIYYSANYGGPVLEVNPEQAIANMGTLHNNNRSFRNAD